ncbi:sensor histidine kinase [Spirochaeta dissipatitropha]
MQLVRELIDTGMLLLLSLVAVFVFFPDTIPAAPFLISLAVLAFQFYTDHERLQLGLLLLFIGLCFALPVLCLFSPAMVYSACRNKHWKWMILLLLPAYYYRDLLGPAVLAVSASTAGLAVVLQRRTWMIENLRRRYFNLKDESRLLNSRLESRQQQLLDQQDAEVHLATMKERYRIARDIHDNVGHLLSSALLQAAALRTAAATAASSFDASAPGPEQPLGQQLAQLQSTLDQAMSSVRESVHHLHETSISLEDYVQHLLEDFRFCPVSCSIDLYSEPGKEQKYAIIAIIKESFSNIMKHSDADEVVLRLREHPGFYQLHMENNGSRNDNRTRNQLEDILHRGIGLRNMQERVETLGGQFRVQVDSRFCLFITLPKQRSGEAG